MTMHWVLSLPCFKKNIKSFSYTLLRLVLFAIYILYLLYSLFNGCSSSTNAMQEDVWISGHVFTFISFTKHIYVAVFVFMLAALFHCVFLQCVARNKSLESRIYNLDAIFLRFVSLYAFHRWNDAIQLKRYNNLVGMCVKVQM